MLPWRFLEMYSCFTYETFAEVSRKPSSQSFAWGTLPRNRIRLRVYNAPSTLRLGFSNQAGDVSECMGQAYKTHVWIAIVGSHFNGKGFGKNVSAALKKLIYSLKK